MRKCGKMVYTEFAACRIILIRIAKFQWRNPTFGRCIRHLSTTIAYQNRLLQTEKNQEAEMQQNKQLL